MTTQCPRLESLRLPSVRCILSLLHYSWFLWNEMLWRQPFLPVRFDEMMYSFDIFLIQMLIPALQLMMLTALESCKKLSFYLIFNWYRTGNFKGEYLNLQAVTFTASVITLVVFLMVVVLRSREENQLSSHSVLSVFISNPECICKMLICPNVAHAP